MSLVPSQIQWVEKNKGSFLNRVDMSVVCNPWSVDNGSLSSKMVQ